MKKSLFLSMGIGSIAEAAISRICPNEQSGICYSLNIPDETASSNDGAIYFQISAPASFQWVGLGQGSRMAGANIFVMYQSSDGQNVTISPRSGVGNFEPAFDMSTRISLLEGSVSDGMMTANVRCDNCQSWNGGDMDFSGPSGSWIYAAKRGEPIQSDAMDAEITYHDFNGIFNWDFAAAKGGGDVNPFVAGSDSQQNTTTTDAGSSGATSMETPSNFEQIRNVHGALACIVFVLIFPLGGIAIRVARFKNTLMIHRTIQMIGYVTWIAAFGLGVYMASTLKLTGNRHPIIGIVVFAIVLFQPLFGWLHHKKYLKTESRNIWSVAHLGIGRIAIILGMVNGGLGLQLARAERGTVIGYSVVAGVLGTAYIASAVYGEVRRHSVRKSVDREAGHGPQVEKGDSSGQREDSVA